MTRAFRPECLRCRYDLTGLDDGGLCPECGLSIQESLRLDGMGTPWQRVGGLKGWWVTFAAMIRRRRRMWETVRLDSASANALETTTILFASMLVCLSAAGSAAVGSVVAYGDAVDAVSLLTALVPVSVVVVLGLFLFNGLVRLAINVALYASGRSLPAAAAQTVIAHASYWLILVVAGASPLAVHWYFGDAGTGCRRSFHPLTLEDSTVVRSVEFALMALGVWMYVVTVASGVRALCRVKD